MTASPIAAPPRHLAAHSATGLAPGEPIAQFEIGEQRNLVYLVLDWKSREAAIVDPQRDLSAPLAAIDAHGFRLTHVLLTHMHSDHVAGVPELAHLRPDAVIHLHEADVGQLPAPVRQASKAARVIPLRDGSRFSLGTLGIEVLHTPGHTPTELCYLVAGTSPPYLLTGDTVFIRDCGRTDFPGGSNAEMFGSIQRIKALPGETVILPGHHYKPETASTVARETRESPPFRCASVAELEALP